MGRIMAGLLTFIFAVAWCPNALAFQNEHSFWRQWQEHDVRHAHDRIYEHREGRGEQTVVHYRGHDENRWYGNHRLLNLRVYYSPNDRQRVHHISYENYDGARFMETMRREHGRYTYRRSYHGEQYYYWIGRETIIRAILRDDGYVATSVWYRQEAERSALERGDVSGSDVDNYGYYDEMPPEIAERYIADVRLSD
ncbi:MAG: hypothetical protein P4N59_00200 [Negativicutes bacterium]|nr:hypothetical protein [Negativicutes bacterium]